MTDTTDIDALVAELRAVAKAPSLAALRPLFSDAADTLECTQAVMQAARIVCSNKLDMLLVKALCEALAALTKRRMERNHEFM